MELPPPPKIKLICAPRRRARAILAVFAALAVLCGLGSRRIDELMPRPTPPPRANKRLGVLAGHLAAGDASTAAAVEGAESTLKPLRLIIAGPPASGKGTQCESIVERFGVVRALPFLDLPLPFHCPFSDLPLIFHCLSRTPFTVFSLPFRCTSRPATCSGRLCRQGPSSANRPRR